MANKRIYPVLGSDGEPVNIVPGVPAVEMLLSEAEAEVLLAYYPPAFTTKRPPGQSEPSPHPLEELPAGLPGPADAGPSDSTEESD